MPKSRGFSLLEMMVTITSGSVVLLGFLALVDALQLHTVHLNLLLERDQNLCVAPLLLVRWVSGAGNSRWRQPWVGLGIAGQSLEIKADSDGPHGFPDGALLDGYENIRLRRTGADLQIRSGSGAFQPALKNMESFTVEPESLPLLRIGLAGTTDRPLPAINRSPRDEVSVSLFLWNYRRNLFEEVTDD